MPVAGAGGFLSNLYFPGLDERLATHITPNPRPLAQEGQGGAGPGTVDQLGNPSPGAPAPASGAPMAPAAVTQPDPINNAYALDLIKASRRDSMAQGINQGFGEIAAGFGTAQQQASKQQALAAGRGGVGGSLADLATIQKMQDTTIADNEHARFMSNAAIFAQTLSRSLGRPVSTAEATEIMNDPEMMKKFGGAAADTAGANATQTPDIKNFNAARTALAESLKRANPSWTPDEIQRAVDARMPPDILATGAGANAEDQAYYAYAAGERAAGRQPADIITWKNQHASELKEADATAVNIANAKKVLPGVTSSVTRMGNLADSVLSREDMLKDILANPNKARWANDIIKADPKSNVALNAKQQGGLNDEQVQLILDIQQLHNMDYRGAFSGEGGVKGIRSQVEADRVSRAADQLSTLVNADGTIKSLKILRGTFNSALANSSGEAQALDQIPEKSRYRLDPSFFEGGVNAPKNLPDWAKVKIVNSSADYDSLADGQAYRAPKSDHGNRILIKGYETQALAEEGT